MVVRTLDGLLGVDANAYRMFNQMIANGQGPGTLYWNFLEGSIRAQLEVGYEAFNRGNYSISTTDGQLIKGDTFLRDTTIIPQTSLSALSSVVPYGVYSNTFTNNTGVERTVKTISLQETITNVTRTQTTSGYSLGNRTSISAEAKVSVPFVGETSFTVSTEFSVDYDWSKETAEETTVSKQLNIPEQEFIVSPFTRLVVDIQLFKIIVPKEDVLLQAEMYGPVTVSPASQSNLSNSNVYVMFDTLNRNFPNIQFNKPDPFIFGLSPLVLNPSRQTVTVNGRGLLDATLTSYQYMVNIKEIPISIRAEDDPNTIKTRSYVGEGEVNETRNLSYTRNIPPLGCPEPTPCPEPEPGPRPGPCPEYICPDQTTTD